MSRLRINLTRLRRKLGLMLGAQFRHLVSSFKSNIRVNDRQVHLDDPAFGQHQHRELSACTEKLRPCRYLAQTPAGGRHGRFNQVSKN